MEKVLVRLATFLVERGIKVAPGSGRWEWSLMPAGGSGHRIALHLDERALRDFLGMNGGDVELLGVLIEEEVVVGGSDIAWVSLVSSAEGEPVLTTGFC